MVQQLINQPEPPFELMTEERNSVLWQKLEAHFKKRLDTLRTQNDGDQPENKTASLRGRIAEAKYLISLGTDPLLPD